MSDTSTSGIVPSSMFGSTVTMLKDAGTGAHQTHDVIANNVANINTPGFKRTDVSFKEALAEELPRYDDSSDLALVTDDPEQIQAGPDFEPKPFSVTTTVDDTQQMRTDGSNVDLDQEMAKLSMNSSYSQTIHALLSVQYSRIREAIEEKA
ncbi:MAG: flagellar basal body rod protein FlgB [Candidatus Lustribacter sp.]